MNGNGRGREVVIVEAVRTPIGRGHPEKGFYKDVHPNELLGRCYTELVERAGMTADRWEIPRSEMDELALRSHQKAARATEEGRFEREIVPFSVNGDTYVADQGIRSDTTLEALAGLKPAFKPDGRITAGNSSQISDGAAAVLLMSAEKAASLGLTPRARIVDQTTVGVDPVIMLTGPIPATRKLLERNRMGVGDIDLFEVNEAFAPVV